MLNLMEITESNKESLISELKGRVTETEQEIISSVNSILSRVKKMGIKLYLNLRSHLIRLNLKL